jgi:hypothetical protein
MLARLGHILEWTANSIAGFSVLLAVAVLVFRTDCCRGGLLFVLASDDLAQETRPWIIGVLLVFAGGVFIIGHAKQARPEPCHPYQQHPVKPV